MTSEIHRRERGWYCVHPPQALAATATRPAGAAITAADVAAPSCRREVGALRCCGRCAFVGRPWTCSAPMPGFHRHDRVEVKVYFVAGKDINQQDRGDIDLRRRPDVIIGFTDAPHIYFDKIIELDRVADYLTSDMADGSRSHTARRHENKSRHLYRPCPFGAHQRPAPVYRKFDPGRQPATQGSRRRHAGFLALWPKLKAAGKPRACAGNAVADGNGVASWLLWSHNPRFPMRRQRHHQQQGNSWRLLKYLKEALPTLIAVTPS